MSKPPASPPHLDYLDGLRAVAAVYVMLHHALLQVDPQMQSLFTWQHGGPVCIFAYGRLGVDLFIVLSGFCLMLPIARQGEGRMPYSALEFFRRRAWRILPPYYFAMLFSLVLIRLWVGYKTGTHWDNALPVDARAIWTHLILCHDILGEKSTINNVFWSIAVEWRLYFFFPVLVCGWRRFGANAGAAAGLLGSYFLMRLMLHFCGQTATIDYLGLFALGLWSASIAFSPDPIMARMRTLPWGSLCALLGVLTFIVLQRELYNVRDYCAGVAFAALLIMLSLRPTHPLRRWLGRPYLVFLGTFAYSIYLVHAPLLQVVWQMLPRLQPHPAVMLAALALVGGPFILLASYLFHLVAERPFLRHRPALAAGAALQPEPRQLC